SNKPKSVEPANWHSVYSAGYEGSLISVAFLLNQIPQLVEESTEVRPGGQAGSCAMLTYRTEYGGANGALVSGRMYLGATDASSTSNYIFTERNTNNGTFETPISVIPDSITIWACFKSNSATHEAFIHTAIHGDANFKLVSDGTYDPTNMLVAKGDKTFLAHCGTSGELVWERMSVPYVIDNQCVCNTPKYILASFATNVVAGLGSSGDKLYIDDVLLIYNPTINVPALSTTTYSRPLGGGAMPISIPYTIQGTMSPYNLNADPNTVVAEISDANGNWNNPIQLNTPIVTDLSGTITGTIPANLPNGSQYKVRIITTNYADTVYCPSKIELKTKYTLTVSGNPAEGGQIIGGGTYDNGTSVTVRANANDGYSFLNWTENGTPVSTNPIYNFELNNNRTLVGNFQQVVTYTITATAEPSQGGSITGAGVYVSGTTVELIATNNAGYNFINWTEDGNQISTINILSFTADRNRTLKANFTQFHTVTLTASPTNGGTVSGGGIYNHGETATVTAIANTPNFVFDKWTENGNTVSTNNIYEFEVNDNKNLTANFTPRYTLQLTANPEEGGTLQGNGTYNSGAQVTAIANVNSGYQFINWTENGNSVSTNSSYTFTIEGNRSLIANFELIPSYIITATSNPIAGGTITGAGTYLEGTNVTLTATANPGFEFVNWTENGSNISTNNVLTFIAGEDRTLTANFNNTIEGHSITLIANPQEGGILTGGGIFEEGAEITVTATTNTNYEFINWTENGIEVSTNNSYSFTVENDRELTANFQYNIPYFDIVLISNPTEGGELTGDGNFGEGTQITVTANANAGYEFVNWTENDTQVSTNPNYSFTVNSNRTLTAHFSRSCTIELIANPTNGGQVYGGGVFEIGEQVTIMAEANPGFNFINWTENGNVISSSYAYTFTVNEDRILAANFSESLIYSISLFSNPANAGITAGGGTFNHGDEATIIASANSNYKFINWTEDGTVISTEKEYKFNVERSRDITANFVEMAYYTITINTDKPDGGTIIGAGSHEAGSEITLIAVPNTNHTFVGWFENGVKISDQSELTIVVDRDMELLASFTFSSIQDYIIENLIVYPNPADDYIILDSPHKIEKLEIISLSGKPVKILNVNAVYSKIDISDLNSGIYILRLKIDNTIINKKIMISK
ncbi:T9SS type A sorting domain-containing protein, partial [Bacteroidales bacterium OttesenSCG-928-K22]|nr:T9SS type A sorting domain-containing protein [Bacteroidales bacterium OttesenSCG-928-K22]